MKFRYFSGTGRIRREEIKSQTAASVPFKQTISAVYARLKGQGIITG